jgi:hypothetical protein
VDLLNVHEVGLIVEKIAWQSSDFFAFLVLVSIDNCFNTRIADRFGNPAVSAIVVFVVGAKNKDAAAAAYGEILKFLNDVKNARDQVLDEASGQK